MNKKNNKNKTLPRSIKRLFPQVTSVTDSSRPISITVEKKDVASARRMEADGCAMAKALCREKGVDGAIVGIGVSYLIKGNTAVRFNTPATVAREITSFDRHDDFDPGEYQLSAISPSQRFDRPRTRPKNKMDARNRHDSADSQKRVIHKETLRVRSMRKK